MPNQTPAPAARETAGEPGPFTVLPIEYADAENNRRPGAYIAHGAITEQQLDELQAALAAPFQGWFIPAQLGLGHLGGQDPTLDGPWHVLILDAASTHADRPAASAAAGPVETEYVGAVDDFVHRVLGCATLGWDEARYQAEIGAPPERWPAPTIRDFPGFTEDFTAMLDEHQEHVTETMSQYVEHGLGVAEANTRAAIRAACALMSHPGVDPEPESAIADHLADLLHLCDAVGQDFEDMLERAYGHYSAELLGVV